MQVMKQTYFKVRSLTICGRCFGRWLCTGICLLISWRTEKCLEDMREVGEDTDALGTAWKLNWRMKRSRLSENSYRWSISHLAVSTASVFRCRWIAF